MRRAIAAAALLAAAFASAQPAEPPRREGAARLMDELMSGKVPVGGDFTLTDAHGRRVSLRDFRGKLVLLYFGFVTCPDICPTDLAEIGKALRALGPKARDIQPIFITLDPPRDTQEILRAYVRAFHPRMIALTGSPDEIAAVAAAYKVFYEKVPVAGASEYTIDHSAFTYLIDREGKYVGIYPPGTHYDRLARMLRDEIPAPN